MKKLILLASIFCGHQAFSQFGPEIFLDSNYHVNDMIITDMNNDGYNDLVTCQAGAVGNVSIYYNDSTGGFGSPNVISTNSYSNNAADIGDFNQDGWTDVIAASKLGVITMYTYNTGTLYSQTDVATGANFPKDIITDDFNADGYPDFVSFVNMSIDVYMNNQNASFSQSNVASGTEYYSICTGDIDGDGDSDIISGSGKLFTFRNDGTGSFSYDSINENSSTSSINICELADMDNDGDLDLVVYYKNTIDKVDWYNNDGTGAFTLAGTITSLANNLYNISIGDINNDGNLDVCLGYDQSGDFVWIESLGNGSYSSETMINSSHSWVAITSLGDIDGDGDMDAFFKSTYGLYYHVNQTILVGVNEQSLSSSSIYPNPAHNEFVIEGVDLRNAKIFIYDALGQEISLNYSYGMNRITINTSSVATGLYFVNIHYKDRVESKTVVIN